MANTKISALTSATTPLAGTEVLPIVQSSATVKVATNDLTVRNVRANATTGILQVTGPAAASTRVMTVPDANFTAARTDAAQSFTGDQTLSTGNLIIGTSGKGIDFSATPGTGTSELLNDYEEGTWTPGYAPSTNSFTSIGYAANGTLGRYVKIGRMVVAQGSVQTSGITVGTASGTVFLTGLPFTAVNPTGYAAYPPVIVGEVGDFLVNFPSTGSVVQNTTTATLLYRATSNGATIGLPVAALDTGAFKNIMRFTVVYEAA